MLQSRIWNALLQGLRRIATCLRITGKGILYNRRLNPRHCGERECACESLARAPASRKPEETRKSRRGLGMPLVMGPGRAGMPLDVVRSKSGRSPVCTTAFTGCCCCAASGWSSLSPCKRDKL